MKSLEGKTAIVTGGSGGLGSEVVRAFLGASADVHVFERQAAEAERILASEKSRITIHEVDMLKEESVAEGFDAVLAKRESVDILVNTVGGFAPAKPLAEVTLDEWNRMMHLNLLSTFLSCREFVRRNRGPYGRIFNMSAMVGLKPTPKKVPYSISKAGVSLLTELLARELAGSGITVHAFAPSIIVTDANKKSMPDADTSTWVRPENIAAMMLALCAPDAGSLSGTTIQAFGGVA